MTERYRTAGYTTFARTGAALPAVSTSSPGGRTVAFVEVSARRRARIDSPAVAVDAGKQRRLRATAAQWLAANGSTGRSARFDVVAVTGEGDERRIDEFTGAF